jgi:hypothetical protein
MVVREFLEVAEVLYPLHLQERQLAELADQVLLVVVVEALQEILERAMVAMVVTE